eukprot:CAMPEP_0201099200 /NCGR_PEP_ID=MMETSP0812-20130820/8219_1 /ASSEMBLY_ACC=CAM_ASM_000668 /TAXON_ID=98059 /ORGANISM="Dinobryon sp., Strain UTEXLB2267" /LENGTH=86 /DNA_ID=CAMNT_0047355003 /DNA_START=150 /DNA_END=407 /DNA_ORIENTATION=+
MVEDTDNCICYIEKKLSSSNSQNSFESSDTSNTEITFLKVRRKVRFNSKVKVVPIPCLEDYKEANIHDSLWWNTEDYELSYKDMIT